jgi:hypothetical protein
MPEVHKSSGTKKNQWREPKPELQPQQHQEKRPKQFGADEQR